MAKYINKFKDENEYNDKKTSLDYPSINYVESLDEIVWLKEMPPFKYYITDLDGNVIFSMPFDENDTTLHYSDLQEFNNTWYNGASYGDFVIGEGITKLDIHLFSNDSIQWNLKRFSVERLVIPSTIDNRHPAHTDEETGEPIYDGEYTYCGTFEYPFGFVLRSSRERGGMIPNEVYIEKGAQIWSLFAWCPIEHADLSNFEYEGQNLGNLFYGASNLKSVILPSGITSLDCAILQECTALEHLEIPQSVTSIEGWALHGCYSLQELTIPSGVTEIDAVGIGNLFSLTAFTLESRYITEHPSLGYAKITSYDIPNWITSLSNYCFQFCDSLTSVTIPDSVSGISQGCFDNCHSLSNVNIGSGVTYIGNYAFQNCGFTKFTIPSGITEIGDYAFYRSESQYNPFDYIILEGTVPPQLGLTNVFGGNQGTSYPLYVPQSVVNDYKSAPRWNTYADRISGYVYDWQTLQDDYICENGDKYEKEELVLNIENGTNYVHTATYRKGSLIESGSTDCLTLPIEGLLINYNAKQYDATESMLPKTEGQLYDENAYVVDANDDPVGNILNVDHLEIDGNMIARFGTQLFNRTDNLENNEYELTVIAKVNPSGDSVTLFGNRDNESDYNWMFRTRADSFVLHGNSEVEPMSVTYPNIIHARVYEENGNLVYDECNMNENNCLGSSYGFAYGSEVQNGAALFSDLYDGPNYESFQGAFYWIAIYNRALTEEEIEEVINYNENL